MKRSVVSKRYAIIFGSGCDGFDTAGEAIRVSTRFGLPSAPVRTAELGGQRVLLLPRHGDAHSLAPHVINYRANLQALRDLGADAVIAMNTVGVITDTRVPGQVAVPAQIIDYTWGREHSIIDGGAQAVLHIDFTEPFTRSLRHGLLRAAQRAGVDCLDGGVYAATQGPRLETAAEINRLESDGADYVGMTAMPEAAIARELELAYACLALVVNHAAGRGKQSIHDDVESNGVAARNQAMRVLEQFFESG